MPPWGFYYVLLYDIRLQKFLLKFYGGAPLNVLLELATLALDVIIQVCCLYKCKSQHNND